MKITKTQLRNMIREELTYLNEETEFKVFYKGIRFTVKGKDLYNAKKDFISKHKVPMSKWGTLAIMSKKSYDDQQFRHENINEAKELPLKDIKMLAKMTDYNNHNEARIYLARKLGNKNLVKSYDALMVLHIQMNQMNDLMRVREKLDKMLFTQAKRYYSNFKDINSAF